MPPSRLWTAYRRTLYRLSPIVACPIALRIGARSFAADALLARFGVQEAVLVTAWNPRSRRMPDGWNRRMQAGLAACLRRRAVLPAEGAWRGWREAHLLVLGPAQPVEALARRFRQTAVVTLRRGAPVRLAWMAVNRSRPLAPGGPLPRWH